MVHRLRREVRPGPVLRHHVGEAPGELYEEVEPGHVVHVLAVSVMGDKPQHAFSVFRLVESNIQLYVTVYSLMSN